MSDSPDHLNDPSLEEQLSAAGWKQGVLFSAPSSLTFNWNELSTSNTTELTTPRGRKVKAKEKLILITQECDIVSDKEPYAEALVCEYRKPSSVTGLGNSARWFVIDPDTGLVAQVKYRLQIDKRILLKLLPEPWPSGKGRLEWFIRWLAWRYDRPAIPNEIVKVFNTPVEAAFHQLGEARPDVLSAFNRAVGQVRVNLPVSEVPPFDIQIVFLLHREELSVEEIDAIDAVEHLMRTNVDPNQVRLGADMYKRTEEQISLADYLRSRPLYLDYYTFEGEESIGSEPPPRR